MTEMWNRNAGFYDKPWHEKKTDRPVQEVTKPQPQASVETTLLRRRRRKGH